MTPFRRVAATCVAVCLCLTAGALGATGNKHGTAKRHPKAAHAKPKARRHAKKGKKGKKGVTSRLTPLATVATGSGPAAAPMLFGDGSVESGVDYNSAGTAEAFPFAAGTAGQALTLSVYVDSHNRATKLIAGVYADQGGHPGSLLVAGSWLSPKSGAWDTIALPATNISSGKTYWLTILGEGGPAYFRDRNSGPCVSETSAQSRLTSLPSTWKSGPAWQTCPVSMYIGGNAASAPSSPSVPSAPSSSGGTPPPPAVPPIDVLAPTVSGTTTQGQTVSTTSGTWSDNSST
ncbi:MAG: hypothetical protein WBQ18_18425, partial [Solirubrobacteraceae bacterium]